MSKTVFRFLFLGLVALFVGCTAAGQPIEEVEPTALPAETAVATPTAEDSATPVREVTPIVATVPVTEEVIMPSNPTIPTPSSPTVQQAKEDLAQRLDIAVEAIEVVQVEEVTWRDGSLGCPQPGMAYTQALVNGTRIKLEANGQIYHYHSGGGAPFLCENPEEPLPPGQGGLDDT